jgi:hypothetical protein
MFATGLTHLALSDTATAIIFVEERRLAYETLQTLRYEVLPILISHAAQSLSYKYSSRYPVLTHTLRARCKVLHDTYKSY